MENKFFDTSVYVLSPEQWMAFGPYLWLCLGIAFTTVCAAMKASRATTKVVGAVFLLPFAGVLMTSLNHPTQQIFGTAFEIDALTRIVGSAVGIFGFVTALFSSNSKTTHEHPEWAALLLTCVLGLSMLPGARDFVSFFVYLETLAITGYIMTSLDTGREKSLEAGIKYLLMGAFASALFLMGITLLYGLTGSFDFDKILEHMGHLTGFDHNFAVVGGILIVAALMFKVSLVPFHMWAPDVYQAAPTSVAAFLATATKLSLFASAAVVFTKTNLLELPVVGGFLYLLAVATIIAGSVLAVAQTQARRLFAYSGIVNAGYAALALCAGARATGSLVTNLLIYGGTLICLFAMIEAFAKNLGKDPHADISLAELGKAAGRSHPLVGGLFTFALFSIAGIPPLPGFFGKYLILKDLWSEGMVGASAVLLLGTLLGLAYYLRVLVPVYMTPSQDKDNSNDSATSRTALFAATLAALVSVMALGGLNRLPQWIHSIEGFAR